MFFHALSWSQLKSQSAIQNVDRLLVVHHKKIILLLPASIASHKKLMYLQVTVAGRSYRVGFVYYDKNMALATWAIIVIVFAVVLAVALVVIGLLLYMRHKKKLRRQREQTMMRGFELVERELSTSYKSFCLLQQQCCENSSNKWFDSLG